MKPQGLDDAGRPGRRWPAVLLAVVCACLSSCTPQFRTLRVGTNDFPGYELLYLARDMGFYGRTRIELLEFPSTTEVLRAYRNGAIDVAAVTADEALLASDDGEEHVLMVFDTSAGADAIYARPGFDSMRSLRGHRVGVETGALGALVLSRALQLNGMLPEDVQVVPLTLDAHESGYRDGAVDAVVTFDPICERLEAAGAVRVFDSQRMPNEIIDLLIAPADTVRDRHDDLASLVKGWMRAREHLQAHRAEALQRLAGRIRNRTADNLGRALDRLEIPDRSKLLQWLGTGPGSLELPLKNLLDLMIRENLLPRSAAPALVLDDRFVRNAGP